jgi:hypothetical protein
MVMPLFKSTTTDPLKFEALITSGQLREGHHLDFKEQMYSQDDLGTRYMLQDIAAFANDGGEIIIGVVDERNTGGGTRLQSLRLDGLAARIIESCQSSLDPPLAVNVQEVPGSASAAGFGYVIVRVPASSVAPHMVKQGNGKRGYRTFMVRRGTQTLAATRAQVAEALALQSGRQEQLNAMLDIWQKDSQLPNSQARPPVLLVVAGPIADHEMALVAALGSPTQVMGWLNGITYSESGQKHWVITPTAHLSSDRITGGSPCIDASGQLIHSPDSSPTCCNSDELLFTGELRRRHKIGYPPEQSRHLWLSVVQHQVRLALRYLEALAALPQSPAHFGIGYRIVGGQSYVAATSNGLSTSPGTPFSGSEEKVVDLVSEDLRNPGSIERTLLSEFFQRLDAPYP